MRTLYIYFNDDPNHIGELYIDNIRGKDVYSFSYTEYALIHNLRNYIIDPEIVFAPGRQFKTDGSKIYRFLEDMMPDRWGRGLIQRSLDKNIISDIDYLINVSDISRMGALRVKEEKEGPFLLEENSIPPFEYINALEDAAYNYDLLEDNEVWKILLSPGSSLGGARPKATIFDNNNELYIAKFNHKMDFYNVSKYEYFTYLLAKEVGINISPSRYISIDEKRGIFLTKRFDRNKNERIPYVSLMTLLGASDGETEKYTYLDIAETINELSKNPLKDLKELFNRIAFYIIVHNYDNHLRNIGMVYKDDSWMLSPAFDINLTLFKGDLALSIDETKDNSLDNLISVSQYFKLNKEQATNLIKDIKDTIKTNIEKLLAKAGLTKEESTKIKNIILGEVQ